MKFLHLASDEKFIDHAIHLFEEAFPKQNEFLIDLDFGRTSLKYIKNKQVKYAIRNSRKYLTFLDNINSYDAVFVHYLSFYRAHLVNQYHSDVKFIWMIWSGDVFESLPALKQKIYLSKTKKFVPFISITKLRNVLRPFRFQFSKPGRYNFSKSDAIKKVFAAAISNRVEYEYLQRTIGLNAEYRWFSYFTVEDYLHQSMRDLVPQGNNILLGNSATPTNNHIEIIDRLSILSLNSKEVICPLSYGSNRYAKKISRYGHSKLGSNFKPVTEFLALKDYVSLISSCSIVIMNHVRSQALGNILTALWIGALVFLRKENPIYLYLKKLGLRVFIIDSGLQSHFSKVDYHLDPNIIREQRDILRAEFSRSEVIDRMKKELIRGL